MRPLLVALALLSSTFTTGCKSSVTANSQQHIVIDGRRYTLIHPGRKNSDGTEDAPLYQKEGDTNLWYTPSLTGRNMIPIMK